MVFAGVVGSSVATNQCILFRATRRAINCKCPGFTRLHSVLGLCNSMIITSFLILLPVAAMEGFKAPQTEEVNSMCHFLAGMICSL